MEMMSNLQESYMSRHGGKRYWALAIPTYVMVTLVLVVGFYIGFNFMSTPPPTSLNTIFGKLELGGTVLCPKRY
ncbi:hypothetical protein SLEP1_g37721 [Rubroshorea leprosula]|uniref:PIG-P domain-containing protein n=1 Tax=Rubroshorea leprosula TaxID=152421 RepID=A0AAV5KVJ4_9ROSI|nr:hypothetical protein SLEP1_g37721 [Rubroshorea leprosula]